MLTYPTQSSDSATKVAPADQAQSKATHRSHLPSPEGTAPTVHSLQGQPQPSSSSAQSRPLGQSLPQAGPLYPAPVAGSAFTLSARPGSSANASSFASAQVPHLHASTQSQPRQAPIQHTTDTQRTALAATGEDNSKPRRASTSDNDEDSTESEESHGKSDSESAGSEPDLQEAHDTSDAELSLTAVAALQVQADRRVSRGRYSGALKALLLIPAAQRTPMAQGYLAAIYTAKSEHAWRKADRERYACAAQALKPAVEANPEALRAFSHVTGKASSDPKLLVQAALNPGNGEDMKQACRKLIRHRHVEPADLVACADKAYSYRFDRLTALLYKRASHLYKKRGEALSARDFARYVYCSAVTKSLKGSASRPIKNFRKIIAETSDNTPMRAWAEHELAVVYHRYFLECAMVHHGSQREAIRGYWKAWDAAKATPSDPLAAQVSRCWKANWKRVESLKLVDAPDPDGGSTLVGDLTPPESIRAP